MEILFAVFILAGFFGYIYMWIMSRLNIRAIAWYEELFEEYESGRRTEKEIRYALKHAPVWVKLVRRADYTYKLPGGKNDR